MRNYKPAMTYGKEVAAMMRDQKLGDEEAAVAFLNELAGTGPALELGIGTGRIALPLAATGVRVDGIDISAHVVEQLRTKPGGDKIDVTIGDFADVPVTGTYGLIYVVWNSFANLLSQEDQVRCFENVASHLSNDGVFAIEMGSPAVLFRLRDNQYVEAEAIHVGSVWLDVLRHDPVTQMLDESHIILSSEGILLNPVMQRYVWPSELDLMARIAGLRLKDRWGDWDRSAWTSRSRTVVSVYGR